MGRSQTEEKIIRSLDFILNAMRHHFKKPESAGVNQGSKVTACVTIVGDRRVAFRE